jgi:superfamily II DNA helicase RecQ
VKIDKVIRHMFGPTGTLRGKQEEALNAVIEGLSPLFIILPTGAGKSLLFMIPSLLEGAKSTIVIVPLVALAENLLDECKKFKVDAILWGRGLPRHAKLIIIITEAVVSSECHQFIQDCFMDGDLERIVFDECHMLVTEEGYRPLLQELWRLKLPVQMVFMSATYPPSFAPIFQDKMVTKEPFTIREENHKPNTTYSVVEYSTRRVLEGILKNEFETIGEGKV